MRDWNGKRYWLVGASEGLGAALAQRLSEAGVELILSARSEDSLRALADKLPSPAQVETVDVTDAEVTLDANHPLAGKDLTFAIELVEIA